ncbi:MAG: DUF1080 domain-containing protein [Sphingomicrobium sp.]
MDLSRRQACRALGAFAGAVATFGAPFGRLWAASLPAYAGPWVPLFNGRNLDGWTYFQDGVGRRDLSHAISVENGVLHMLGSSYSGGATPGFGHVATVDEYDNYHLRLQFKFGERRFEPRLLAKRNSGVLYHMGPELDRVYPNCIEFQLEESDVGDAILVNTRCWPGFDAGGTPAWPTQVGPPQPLEVAPREPRPAIERQRVIKNGDFETRMGWNTIELLAIGSKAAHLVNGRIVTTLYNIIGQIGRDRSYHALSKGRIAVELEGAECFFRNIEIRKFTSV